MNVKIDIHNNHNYERKLKYIKNWKTPDSVKREIEIFVDKAKLGQVRGKEIKRKDSLKIYHLAKKSIRNNK